MLAISESIGLAVDESRSVVVEEIFSRNGETPPSTNYAPKNIKNSKISKDTYKNRCISATIDGNYQTNGTTDAISNPNSHPL